MDVKSAKVCFYILLSCLALFVTEIMAINHRAESGIYGHILGINTSVINPSKRSPTQLLRISSVNRETIRIPKQIDVENLVYQGFFKQIQNHFDYLDSTIWLQRYYVSKKYTLVAANSPVIFLLGGLHELQYSDFKTGVWDEMAKETKSLLVCLEHRYHGQSEPTTDLSIDNLLYLNSEQALADAAWFIKNARRNKVDFLYAVGESKWIVVGASHGGALAAKLKLKFPHLLAGALAVGAPLLATMKFTGSFEAILAELNTNVVAKNTVLKAYQVIQDSIDQVPSRFQLNDIFKVCEMIGEVNQKNNLRLLLWSISTLLGFALQSKWSPHSIKDEILATLGNQKNRNELNRFQVAITKILDEYSLPCIDVDYDKAVSSYVNKTWDSPIDDLLYFGLGNRQDLFQSCTQFGQFEVYGPYVTLDFYGDFCIAVFGRMYELYNLQQGVIRTNMFYGGLNIVVEDVYFISDSQDFFIQLGIVNNTPKNSEAVCINDPFYLNQEDTDCGTSTRNGEWDKIVSKLKQWTELAKSTNLSESTKLT